MNQERILDISWGTILKIFIAVVCFYILYLIRDLLIWFLFALIISILFNPAIDFLQQRRVPRIFAVVLVYLGVFGLFSILIYSVVPIFISEIQQFSQFFPSYFEKISPILRQLGFEAFESFEVFMESFGKTLQDMAANIFNALFAIFGGVFSTLFVITVAIFISLEERPIERALILLFPKKYEAYILSLWERCQRQVSGWFGVRILGCIFVGITCYFAFLLFNIKYPFSLALLAGTLEFVPIIGPLITAIILLVMASLDSFLKAIFVLLFFAFVQMIEGNMLTPVLAKKFIGLPPALVLMSLAVGGYLFGLLGAVLFVPLMGIVFEFARDFLRKRREEKAVIL